MGDRTCSIPDCNGKLTGLGWCSKHYQRYIRHGDPLVRSKPKTRRCAEPECDTAVTTATYCRACYKRRKRQELRESRSAVSAVCANCSSAFEFEPGLGRKRKYCTVECREAVLNAREHELRRQRRSVGRVTNCQWCGVDITHRRNCAKACSKRCANLIDQRDNPERCKATALRWQEENRDRIREDHRRYYQQNRERLDAIGRAWREANPERKREIARKHARKVALEDPERIRLAVARRSAHLRGNGGGALLITKRDWCRLLAAYWNCCAYCGDQSDKLLEMEHVIPLARGGRHAIGNIVPACARCNRSKNDRLLVEWRFNRSRTRAARRQTHAALGSSLRQAA